MHLKRHGHYELETVLNGLAHCNNLNRTQIKVLYALILRNMVSGMDRIDMLNEVALSFDEVRGMIEDDSISDVRLKDNINGLSEISIELDSSQGESGLYPVNVNPFLQITARKNEVLYRINPGFVDAIWSENNDIDDNYFSGQIA